MRHALRSFLLLTTALAVAGCSAAPSSENVESSEAMLGSDGGAEASTPADASAPSDASAAAPALVEVTGFGPNPGALKMFEYVPAKVAAKPATVVVLHGCQQRASDVAKTGWNDLADQLGFVLVYPEQVAANNQALCFNWGGVYGDMTTLQRGKDENQSIKEMVDKAVGLHAGDAKRVFVVGFSAGGGEAAIMAAAWPEVFAGVATIAGIPYRCNTTFAEAFSCQKPGKDKTPAEWAALVKEAHAGYNGTFPRMSIWQGASDSIVSPTNRNELVEQWTEVHGVGQTPTKTETIDGANHATFKDSKGNIVVETYEVPGMDHGVALGPNGGKKCGTAGQYSLDKGICTAARVASFFGLDAPAAPDAGTKPPASGSSTTTSGAPAAKDAGDSTTPSPSSASSAGGAAPAANDGSSSSAGATCAFSSSSPSTSALGVLFAALALVRIVRRNRKEVSQ